MNDTPRHAASAWPAEAAALLGLAAGASLLLAAGPAPQIMYAGDVANYLDACHRSFLGQVLGSDFTAPIGPAALLPGVIAMRLRGQADVNALASSSMLCWLGFGLGAWLLARRRLSHWCASVFTLFVAGTAAAPYTLDFGGWNRLSYGMSYNRQAWAMLALLCLAALLRPRGGFGRRSTAVILGISGAWLALSKPNYLAVWLPLALATSPDLSVAGSRLATLVSALTGALGTLLLTLLLVPFHPLGYLQTLVGMGGSVGGELLADSLRRTLSDNIPFVTVLVLVWFIARTAEQEGDGVRMRLTSVGLGLILLGVLLANLANCQFAEIPLWGALGWILLERLHLTRRSGWRHGLAWSGAVLLGASLTWQPLASIPYTYLWKTRTHSDASRVQEIDSPAWSGLPLRPQPATDPNVPAAPNLEDAREYALWLNDGLGLLRQHLSAADRVLCLDWSNPFPFATSTAPPSGDEIAWHVGRTISREHHPDVSRLLQDATILMEPLQSLQPDSLSFKRRLFADGMSTGFILAKETKRWRIWLRRDRIHGAPAPDRP